MLRKTHNSDLRRKRKTAQGFSLIELLVVIAIILIIAAISIPNYLHSKMTANEAATIQNIRNITTAEVIYSTTFGIGYSQLLLDLGGTGTPTPTNAILIDDILARGSKAGFNVTYVPKSPDTAGKYTGFTVNAAPINYGNSGARYFYTDQTGVIRQSISSVATATDTPI